MIRAGSHDQQDKISSTPASLCSVEDTCNKIDEVMVNLKKQLRQQPLRQLVSGAKKIVERYAALSQKPAVLISALHRFGWVFGGSISSRKFRKIHGKRITVQATATGRRRRGRHQLYLDDQFSVWWINIPCLFTMNLKASAATI